jgi:hypothetical protein
MAWDSDIAFFALVGFLAQLVDGSIGMAFGTLSNVLLLALGLPPSAASASVNAAKAVTNGFSAASHAYFRNVDRRLLFGLVLPAVLGAVVGGVLVARLRLDWVATAVSAYLVVIGVLLIVRASRQGRAEANTRHPILSAFAAGVTNSAAGSFGPLATSALLARGVPARYAIGTVSVIEFVVALASVATLMSLAATQDWRVVAGLVLGGLPAAPLAAYLVRHVPTRVMMLVVGSAVALLSTFNLLRALGFF